MSSSNIDQNILEYIDKFQDDFTLEFLQQVHNSLIEMKAGNLYSNWSEYYERLKNRNETYDAEISALSTKKKELELKLKMLQAKHEEELNIFNDVRVEQILKHSTSRNYLEQLNERNRHNEKMIHELRKELDKKKADLAKWIDKYNDVERKCRQYFQESRDLQLKQEKYEAERGSSAGRDRRSLNFNMNSRPDTSFIETVPPPPPIEMPPVAELMKDVDDHLQNSYDDERLDLTVPPPPPLDVEDIFEFNNETPSI